MTGQQIKKVTGQPLHKQWMISKLLNTEEKEEEINKKIDGEQMRSSKGLAVGSKNEKLKKLTSAKFLDFRMVKRRKDKWFGVQNTVVLGSLGQVNMYDLCSDGMKC